MSTLHASSDRRHQNLPRSHSLVCGCVVVVCRRPKMPLDRQKMTGISNDIEIEIISQSDSSSSSPNQFQEITTSETSLSSSSTGNNSPTSTFENDTKQEVTHNPPTDEAKFDPNSYIYMANACCELLHYRSAALVVAVLEVLLLVGYQVNTTMIYLNSGNAYSIPLLIGQILSGLVIFSIILFMVFGVVKEKPKFFWPHLAIQIGFIIIAILFTLLAVISMAFGTDCANTLFGIVFGSYLPTVRENLGPIWPFCLAVIFDFKAAVAIWFYILVRGCYDYLLDKKFFEQNPVNRDFATNTVLRSATFGKSDHEVKKAE